MSQQRGNILFLILLAVVLFAALAYMVTSSLRGGGKDGGDEKANTQASQILNYFTELDTAVQRMMLTNGVKDYELNFKTASGTPFIYGNFDNTNCTESRCRVFDPAGGAVTGRDLSPFTRNPATAAASTLSTARIMYINVPGVGTSSPEIVMTIQGVSQKTCQDINGRFGGGFISGGFNIGSSVLMYQYAIPTGPISDNSLSIAGLPLQAANAATFCTCRNYTTWDTCTADVFYPQILHVLVAR